MLDTAGSRFKEASCSAGTWTLCRIPIAHMPVEKRPQLLASHPGGGIHLVARTATSKKQAGACLLSATATATSHRPARKAHTISKGQCPHATQAWKSGLQTADEVDKLPAASGAVIGICACFQLAPAEKYKACNIISRANLSHLSPHQTCFCMVEANQS